MNVEQLRQLEQAATPASWETGGPWLVKAPGKPRAVETMDSDDARLIAAARNALPALLDIAEELRGVVEAGQLPEAETAIFADMLARLETEGQR